MSSINIQKIKYKEHSEESTEKEEDFMSQSQNNLPVGKSIWTKFVKKYII